VVLGDVVPVIIAIPVAGAIVAIPIPGAVIPIPVRVPAEVVAVAPQLVAVAGHTLFVVTEPPLIVAQFAGVAGAILRVAVLAQVPVVLPNLLAVALQAALIVVQPPLVVADL